MHQLNNIISSFKKIWDYFNRRKKIQFSVLLLLMVFCSFLEAFSISAVFPMMNVFTNPEKLYINPNLKTFINLFDVKSPKELIFYFILIFISLIFLSAILRVLLLWAQLRLGFSTSASFSKSIYLKTLYQPYSVFISRNSSEVISGITTKANAILVYLVLPIMNLVSSVLNILMILITLLIINFKITLLLFTVFGFFYITITLLVRKRLSLNSFIISKEEVKMIKAMQEGLGGIRDIILDGTQNIYSKVFDEAQGKLNKSIANNQLVAGIPRFVVEFLGILLILLIAYFLISHGNGLSSAMPTLGVLALGSQRLIPSLQNLYSNWTIMLGGIESVKDGLNLMEQPFPLYANKANPEKINFQNSIVLENVSFRYSNESPDILKNINLKLEKGKKYGFVGTTGCGKSTLIDIIMSLLQPTKGKLLIDGVEINKNNFRSWQLHISHVPQQIYLSDSSIKENVAFGIEPEKINLLRVKEASANAKISETIENMPLQYDSFVGERGVRLSGGQCQRIGIARALYKSSSVIILDEATSALDDETEKNVMNNIEKLSDDVTLIIIAHRLSTLKKCDKIFKLNNGEITEIENYNSINL
jgi:ABC-type multidrug transport system fused ATPase/permease subunit